MGAIFVILLLLCFCEANDTKIYAGVCGASSSKGSNTKPKKQCVGGGPFPCDRVGGNKPCCNNTACSGGANAKSGDYFACTSCEGPSTSSCIIGAVYTCSSAFTVTQSMISVGYSPNSVAEGSDSVLTITIRNVFPLPRGDSKRRRGNVGPSAPVLKKQIDASRGRSRRSQVSSVSSSSSCKRSDSVSTSSRGLQFSLFPIDLPSFQEIASGGVLSNTCTGVIVTAEVGSSSISFSSDNDSATFVVSSCSIAVAITTVSGGFSGTSVAASYVVPTTTATTFSSADATLFTAPCVEGPVSAGEPTETHDAPISASSAGFSSFHAEKTSLCSVRLLYRAASSTPQVLTVSVYAEKPQVNVTVTPPVITVTPVATSTVTVDGSACLIGGSAVCTVVAKFLPPVPTTPLSIYTLGLSTIDASTSGIWLGVEAAVTPFLTDVFDIGVYGNMTITDPVVALINDPTTRLLYSVFGA